MSRRIEPFKTIACAILFVALLQVAPPPAAAVVPTQWIAKQYTELLGRAPTNGEWNFWQAYYSGVPCNADSLAFVGKTLLRSDMFLNLYPTDKAARVIAMVRAVYNYDPDMSDWNAFYVPYNNGTKTWDQIVDSVYSPGFAFFLVPGICSATSTSYGFTSLPGTPMDILSLTGGGPSRTQQQLQAALDAANPGDTVWLNPKERIFIGPNQNLRIKSGVTLATVGLPDAKHYAQMGRLVPNGLVCGGFVCNHSGIVKLEPGAVLKNVWVDGIGTDPNYNWAVANVISWGSTVTNPTQILDNRLSEPGRAGTAVRALGLAVSGAECTGQRIERNLITGYRSKHAQDGLGQPLWTSGISVFCEDAQVRYNEIVDVTDTGIMLYGNWNRAQGVSSTQRSVVTNNTVLSAGNDALAAFGADSIGQCLAAQNGWVVPCVDRCVFSGLPPLSFAGSSVSANTFWTGGRTSFDVGLLVGGKTFWGEHGCYGTGASFTNNTAPSGTRVNVGIAVMGMYNVTLTGNTGSYQLVDGNPAITELECPQVNVGVGSSPAEASVLAGAQSYTPNLDSLKGCLLPPPPASGLERLAINGDFFVGSSSGRQFNAWGMNWDVGIASYFTPAGFPELIRNLRNMRRLGVNAVRLLLQFNSFVNAPNATNPNGVPNVTALDYLARIVGFAEQLGMYVDITGLGIQILADQPAWYDCPPPPAPQFPRCANDEAARWAAQRVFWSNVAGRLKNSAAVMFYDLMNEPAVHLNGAVPNWYAGDTNEPHYVQYLTRDIGARTRETVVRAWATQMINAIRISAGDTQHPISIGVQGVAQFGLPPEEYDDLVDLILLHKYLFAGPCDVPAAIDVAASYKFPSKPLLIEETYLAPCLPPVFEEYVFGTRAEAGVTGWFGFYKGTPPEADLGTFHLMFQQTFLKNAGTINPTGNGIAQP